MLLNLYNIKMKKLLGYAFLCLSALHSFGADCFADENIMLSPDYFRRTFYDLGELPSKPAKWSKNQWLVAGGIISATAGALFVDGDIRQYFRDHRSGFLNDLSDTFTHFGDYKVQAPLLGGAWIAGLIFKSDTLNKIAGDGAEASLIAAAMITPAIVFISGRALPRDNEPALKFEPFTSGRFSFPSGHTTEAFAVATVLDVDLREKFGYWHSPVVYGIAASVGISRVYDHAHYLSDVILGAGIGWSVGYWIASKPRNQQSNVSLVPAPGGLLATWSF